MSDKRSAPEPPFPVQELSPPGLEARMDPKPRYEAPGYRAAEKLRNKTALITGGDSGIGRAVAVLFAREGANVAIVHLSEETADAEKTAQEVRGAGSRCLAIAGDVRHYGFCESTVERVVGEFGGLDILVNNAAFQKHRDTPHDISLEQWDRTLRTNVDGYFHMVRAALPHLDCGAAIINTGSVTGLEGSPRLLDYAASKGAIHAFTKSLAGNLVDRGIRVNCVAPGPVWTPLNPAERDPAEVTEFGADTPMGRPAQPDEIAPAYVFFASAADSGYITGNVLPILGGETVAG